MATIPPLSRAWPANAARSCLTRPLARLETTGAVTVFSKRGITQILRCRPISPAEETRHTKEGNAVILMQVCSFHAALRPGGRTPGTGARFDGPDTPHPSRRA